MKLKKATIFNYKTIASETTLEVDDRITALLGKSESGKTNVLEAINSAFTQEPYRDEQRCSWSADRPDKKDVVAELTFELEEQDAENLDPTGEVLKGGMIVSVRRNWSGELTAETNVGDRFEERISDELVSRLSHLRRRARSLLRQEMELASARGWPSEVTGPHKAIVASLVALLRPRESEREESSALTEALAIAEQLREGIVRLKESDDVPESRALQIRATRLLNDLRFARNKNVWETVTVPPFDIEALRESLPRTRYVPSGEKGYLSDEESVRDMTKNPDAYPLHRALLELGGLDMSTLAISNRVVLKRHIDRGQRKICEALSALWSQELIEVVLDVDGDHFRVQLKGPEGHYGTPGHRSEGFQWFLSFYLRHLAPMATQADTPTRHILLIDEPGLYLHASAQQDLLRLFDSLGQGVQIIYTSHSPFMLNKNYPHRIRQVEKRPHPVGTRLNNTPYHSQHGLAWEPVRTAIGVTAGNSLFVAGQNLVVEGISDQILLAAVSQRLTRETGGVLLDLDRVAICPADGAQSAVPLGHYCASCSDNVVVLLDNDEQGKKAKKRLEKGQVLQPDKVLLLDSEAKDAQDISVEDLVDADLYHEAVLAAYAAFVEEPTPQELPASRGEIESFLPGPKEEPPSGKPVADRKSRNTVQIYKEFWKEKGWGDFSKTFVAKKLAQMAASGESPGWESTLSRFERLFVEINRVLALPFKRPVAT